jgi:signal transduction histidine kinase/ActR/RegA family two-component response regulator
MPSVEQMARSLLATTDAGEALVTWLQQAAPAATFAVRLDHQRRVRECARCDRDAWQPSSLPPLTSRGLTGERGTIDLQEHPGDAFTDLLASLGLRHLLVLPLAPAVAGGTVLARAREPFTEEEIQRLGDAAELLGPSVAAHERRAQEGARQRLESDEIARLFDLMRELGRVSDPERAVRLCGRTLQDLLAPLAGAFSVQLSGRDQRLEQCWPETPLGQQALERARGRAGSSSLHWVDGPSRGDGPARVGLALGWLGRAPARAERVVGAVEGFLCQALDRLEDQRLQEEGRLKEIVEGLPLGVALLDAGGRLRVVNGNGRQLLESVGAWPGEGGVVERFGTASLRPLIEQAAEGKPAAAEIYLQSQCRTFSLRVVPAQYGRLVPGDRGEALLVIEDVTQAVNQKRQLAQSEKLSALGELISGVVHELNNPLSTVIGYAEMLSQVPESGSRERWVDTILDESQRCQRIVRNMLSLTRGDGDGSRCLVSMGGIAERALSLVSYPFRSAGVSATLSVDADTAAVRGDPDALLQVLINLLTNALHALEGLPGEREVRLSIENDGDQAVMLRVADNGPGVPRELRDRIFEPFFTTKGEGKGTGLGLRLVRTIVEDHGGHVRCESEPAAGAEFVVTLPVAHHPSADEAAVLDAHRKEAPREGGRLAGARVTVIDDEPAVADVLSEVLRHAGARVETEYSSERALNEVLGNAPDVILCDLHMPHLSGDNLLAELHGSRPELTSRLIFTTGATISVANTADPKHAGRPCLLKPFDFERVIETIREVWRASVRPTSSGAERPGARLEGDEP